MTIRQTEDGSLYEEIKVRGSLKDFQEEVAEWLERSQNHIDQQLAAGASFIVSSSDTVHTLTCPTMKGALDLRACWPFNGDLPLEDLWDQVHHGGYPLLPKLRTAEQVNQKRRYSRCKVCSPDVADKLKWDGPTTRAGAVNRTHIGRMVDGVAVEWVRLEAGRVTLGLTDGRELPFDVEDRITFDPKPKGGAMS